MGKRVLIAAAAIAALVVPGAAYARADNSRPASDEDRIENRAGGGATASNRQVRPRVEKRKAKRRYPLM